MLGLYVFIESILYEVIFERKERTFAEGKFTDQEKPPVQSGG